MGEIKMSKRRFSITFEVKAEIELDDRVIDVVDDEWRASLYDLHTPEDIAEMIGRCLVKGWRLSSLDGWADQPDSNAILLDDEWDIVEINEDK
jgi:hypothetical protein